MARKILKKLSPTRQELTEALIDPWKLADLINFHGGKKAFGKCHHELANFVWGEYSHNKQLILMPRGHLKTTVSSVLRILHTLYLNPNVRIFIGCLSKSLSNSIMREVQAFLLDEWNQENVWNNRPHIEGRLIPVMDKLGKQRRYQRKYEEETWAEDKKIIWRSDAIQVIRNGTILKEPSVVVGSVESSATGHHYDELIFDDIINFSNYNTPNKQQSIDRWLGDMESVLDPEYFDQELYEELCGVTDSQKYREIFQKICHIGNKISIVGTLYFKDDLYDRIIKANEADLKNGDKPEYHVFKRNIYANGVDNTDGYLWAEKWNEDLEKQKRKSINMTSEIWASQYLNMIISPESKCLQWEKVRFIHPQSIVKVRNTNNLCINHDGEQSIIFPILVVDPAATTNKKSDYTAIAVGGQDRKSNLFVLDLKLGKWTTDEWIKVMYKLVEKWGLYAVTVEMVAFQQILRDVIRSYFGSKYRALTIRDYRPSRTGKKERIETAIQPLLENGLLWMSTYLSQNTEIKDQFNFFPRTTMKDDALDVLTMLRAVSKAPINDPRYRTPFVPTHNRKYGGFY